MRAITTRLCMVALSIPALLSGCTTDRATEAVRDSADHQFALGNYPQAAADYRVITERYPGDGPAQHRLGVSLMKIGDLEGARRALEIAHTNMPNDADVADDLAECLFRQDDLNRLYAFLRERAQSTQEVHAYLRLADYARALNDPDSAKPAIETAIELDGGQTTEPYLAAADFAEELGNIDLALRRLRQAYWINPHDVRVREQMIALGEVPGPSIALPPGR